MPVDQLQSDEALAEIVKQCLKEGLPVELDGLGVFHFSQQHGLQFIAETEPRVFIAYVEEDAAAAMELADDLAAAGMKPWIDKRRLLPGQDWRRAIERAIDNADFFLPCFSRRATRKRGQFPYEIRHALRCAERMPLDDAFVVPVRLDACDLPETLVSRLEYVDLFPDWVEGTDRLVHSLRKELRARRKRDGF